MFIGGLELNVGGVVGFDLILGVVLDIQIDANGRVSVLNKTITRPPMYQRLVPLWPMDWSEIMGPPFLRLTQGPMAPWILSSLVTNISS